MQEGAVRSTACRRGYRRPSATPHPPYPFDFAPSTGPGTYQGESGMDSPPAGSPRAGQARMQSGRSLCCRSPPLTPLESTAFPGIRDPGGRGGGAGELLFCRFLVPTASRIGMTIGQGGGLHPRYTLSLVVARVREAIPGRRWPATRRPPRFARDNLKWRCYARGLSM
jgi:hypothetical protein